MRKPKKEKILWFSRWVQLVEVPGEKGEAPYHGLRQNPYVGVLPILPGRHFIIIRQFRPLLGRFTWEFPAGTVDPGVSPLDAAQQELWEEVGLRAKKWSSLGVFFPDTGRLAMASYGFLAECRWQGPSRRRHGNFEVKKVSWYQLQAMIRSGEFRHQLHLGLLGAWIFRQKKSNFEKL